MNEAVINVLNGFFKLTEQERNTLLREIANYRDSSSLQKSQTERLTETRNTGPKNGFCKCCGR